MSQKIEFFYNKESFANSFQRTNAVALNPNDETEAYTLAASTSVWVVDEYGKGSFGLLNAFYQVRNIAAFKPNTIIYNLLSDYGNLSFTIVIPDLFFEKDRIYETYCTYRDGIFTTSVSPRVTAVALTNPEETRAYAVYF
jgi:hypothetical protein